MVKTKPKPKIDEQKKEQLKSLTKKYFIKQKIIEVTLFFVIIMLAAIVIPILGAALSVIDPDVYCTVFYNSSESCVYIESYSSLFEIGILASMLLALVVLVTFSIYMILKTWINNNWERASKRARADLNIDEDDVILSNKIDNVNKIVSEDSYY